MPGEKFTPDDSEDSLSAEFKKLDVSTLQKMKLILTGVVNETVRTKTEEASLYWDGARAMAKVEESPPPNNEAIKNFVTQQVQAEGQRRAKSQELPPITQKVPQRLRPSTTSASTTTANPSTSFVANAGMGRAGAIARGRPIAATSNKTTPLTTEGSSFLPSLGIQKIAGTSPKQATTKSKTERSILLPSSLSEESTADQTPFSSADFEKMHEIIIKANSHGTAVKGLPNRTRSSKDGSVSLSGAVLDERTDGYKKISAITNYQTGENSISISTFNDTSGAAYSRMKLTTKDGQLKFDDGTGAARTPNEEDIAKFLVMALNIDPELGKEFEKVISSKVEKKTTPSSATRRTEVSQLMGRAVEGGIRAGGK